MVDGLLNLITTRHSLVDCSCTLDDHDLELIYQILIYMSHLQLFYRGCQYMHHYSSSKIRLLVGFNAKPNILKRNGKLSEPEVTLLEVEMINLAKPQLIIYLKLFLLARKDASHQYIIQLFMFSTFFGGFHILN